MRIDSPDFETELIAPGNQAPAPVCLAIGRFTGAVDIYPTSQLEQALAQLLVDLITTDNAIIGGVNIAFDMAVALKHRPRLAPLIWEAYNQEKIIDWGVWDFMAQIEQRAGPKRPSMADLCMHYRVQGADKNEDRDVRLTYGQFINRPLSDYTPDHIRYALLDGYSGQQLGEVLYQYYPDLLKPAGYFSKRAFSLALARNRGLPTDPKRRDQLEKLASKEVARLRELAQTPLPLPNEDWIESDDRRCVRSNGTKNMKRIRAWVRHAYEAQGAPVPMTRAKRNRKSKKPFIPKVKTSKEVLADSGHPFLETLQEYGEWSAVLNKDVKMLSEPVLHTRFGMAATTRTTTSNPNVQNFRRAAGIRECIVPPPGYCFVATDHSGAELVAAAQNAIDLLGRDHMASMINDDLDLHAVVAVEIHGHTEYSEFLDKMNQGLYWDAEECQDYAEPGPGRRAYKELRQFAKIPNFGCLGGMSDPTSLVMFARQQGVRMNTRMAIQVLKAWRRANPDGQALLDYVRYRLPKRRGAYEVPIMGTSLIRRGCWFHSAANCLFQSRVAVAEAECGWQIARDEGIPGGVLHSCGAESINFIHDEFFQKTPIGTQTVVGLRTQQIMQDTAQPFFPDVKIKAETAAMDRWTKDAKPIWENGELQIWHVE